MGTRHLIAVQLDGQYRIAQYGQWDGYPQGQGESILAFLDRMDRPAFEAKLRATSFFTTPELEALGEDWKRRYPHLSRDAGADILDYVMNSDNGIKLKDSIDFAGDGLFCEYGYVIDLDKNVLEVFKGFGKEPLVDGQRFKDSPRDKHPDGTLSEYHPIRMAASYPLDALPSVDKMAADVDGFEEEEAA